MSESNAVEDDGGLVLGEETTHPDRLRLTRRLARAAETIHGLTYYGSEINRFKEDGFRGWWHAYFAYRLAPLGPIGLPVATAVCYNFAPRMVGRAVPGVWDIMAPDQILTRRNELVGESLERVFGDGIHNRVIGEAAELAAQALDGLDFGARPLAAAHATLQWPTDPARVLHHACTIWREYRGDGHNIALAAAGIDGPSSHLLMMASGRGDRATITRIRGWTAEEWDEAAATLIRRGVLDRSGEFTDHGAALRAQIETTTDELSLAPVHNLGDDRAERLFVLLASLSEFLKASGEVAGAWPPPTVTVPPQHSG